MKQIEFKVREFKYFLISLLLFVTNLCLIIKINQDYNTFQYLLDLIYYDPFNMLSSIILDYNSTSFFYIVGISISLAFTIILLFEVLERFNKMSGYTITEKVIIKIKEMKN